MRKRDWDGTRSFIHFGRIGMQPKVPPQSRRDSTCTYLQPSRPPPSTVALIAPISAPSDGPRWLVKQRRHHWICALILFDVARFLGPRSFPSVPRPISVPLRLPSACLRLLSTERPQSVSPEYIAAGSEASFDLL